MAKLQIYLPDGAQPVHDLPDERLTVGRLADNGLHLDDPSVSSHHAELHFEDGVWHLHDLDSTNGTFVNGEKVTDAVLRHADEVRFGAIETVFSSEEEQPDQPPPESAAVTAEAARASARPATFVSSSPIAKDQRSKDPVAAILIGSAVVAILVFAAAAFLIMQMAVPA
jgi:pSer/pThr/pTyr-binding forkhead associated (FHA) protein